MVFNVITDEIWVSAANNPNKFNAGTRIRAN